MSTAIGFRSTPGTTSASPPTSGSPTNARTSLTWERSAALCDRSARRGDCPPIRPPFPSVPSGVEYSLFLRDSNTSGVADRTAQFGPSRPAQILMCDWDGDGTETPTWFEGGDWVASDRLDGSGAVGFGYGDGGDTAVCGDWNGDGAAGPGIVRQGVWYLAEQSGHARTADRVFGYGDRPDVPIVGDWNGDGRATPGVFRCGHLVPRQRHRTTAGRPRGRLRRRWGRPDGRRLECRRPGRDRGGPRRSLVPRRRSHPCRRDVGLPLRRPRGHAAGRSLAGRCAVDSGGRPLNVGLWW